MKGEYFYLIVNTKDGKEHTIICESHEVDKRFVKILDNKGDYHYFNATEVIYYRTKDIEESKKGLFSEEG